jgi:poly-gamma-glutamate synthesis protein (capsule biosynthesis protein)
MIFLGDIAIPFFAAAPAAELSGRGPVVANFEGAVAADNSYALLRKRLLFNSTAAVEYLQAMNVQVAALANNHILDIGQSPARTIEVLRGAGIRTCGAGTSLAEAAQAAVLTWNGKQYVFLAFGWAVIGCPPAGTSRPGVNPLTRAHVLASLSSALANYPEAAVVLLMHWNYELEVFPQPMHRQIALECIDAGAAAVIGCHPHCVGGVEWRSGRPVVYSLGNWMLPQGLYFGGTLRFPDRARLELAFEWQAGCADATCHWYEYVPGEHILRFVRSENARSSALIRRLTGFAGLDHREYLDWFRQPRIKRRGLPVYHHCSTHFANHCRDAYVRVRQEALNWAFASGLRRCRSDASAADRYTETFDLDAYRPGS